MKKAIYILTFFLFAIKLSSQNIDTEIKYLINANRQNKELISDNLRNAEICALKIIQNPDSFKNKGNTFFEELAKSYYLTKNYEFVLLTYFRQRCFYPKKNDSYSKEMFFNSAELIKNKDYKLYEELFENTSYKNIPNSYEMRFELFLKACFKSGFKNADKFENIYSDLYKKNILEEKTPYWIKQHDFYSKIKIKPKYRKKLYSFLTEGNTLFISKSLTKRQKHKICNKALKYYIHSKNKVKVKEYVKFCKENKINYCLGARFKR